VRKRNFIKRINKAFDDLDNNMIGYFDILDGENGYLASKLDEMNETERMKATKTIEHNREIIEKLSSVKIVKDAISGKRW